VLDRVAEPPPEPEVERRWPPGAVAMPIYLVARARAVASQH
jgi:hypothetical protein